MHKVFKNKAQRCSTPLTISYSKIKKRYLVLINNATYIPKRNLIRATHSTTLKVIMHVRVFWFMKAGVFFHGYYTYGCTPPKAVPILFCVKAYTENRHFRVFIMIRISQTHVFLKEYVHIHQMGSHFVGGYRLDFRRLSKKL